MTTLRLETEPIRSLRAPAGQLWPWARAVTSLTVPSETPTVPVGNDCIRTLPAAHADLLWLVALTGIAVQAISLGAPLIPAVGA